MVSQFIIRVVAMDANVVALHRGYDQTFQAREQRFINTLALQRTVLSPSPADSIPPQYGSVLGQLGAGFRAITLTTPPSAASRWPGQRYCRHYGIPIRCSRPTR